MSEVVKLHELPAVTKEPYCETSTTRAIGALLDTCLEYQLFGLIIGEPGTGKSGAVAKWCAEHKRCTEGQADKAVLVTATQAKGKLQPFLRHISEALGEWLPDYSSTSVISDRIAHNLETEVGAIVVDEATNLEDKTLIALKDIFDTGIAVVLVGNPHLDARLVKRKPGETNILSQIEGRVGRRLPTLTRPADSDVDAICDHHGIASRDARDLIKRAAGGRGALHKLRKMIEIAGRVAGEGKPITYNAVRDASKFIGGV